MTKKLFDKRVMLLEQMDPLESDYLRNDLKHQLFYEIKKELINLTDNRAHQLIAELEISIVPEVIDLLARAIKFYKYKKIILSREQRLKLIYLIIINYSQIIESSDDQFYIFKTEIAYRIDTTTN